MTKLKTVPLGEVLRLMLDEVKVDAAETYHFAGVYSFGRGLFARGPLSGAKTSYKCFHRLHAGDFVISEPKAWEGAIARIPSSFDGWFLSPVFPTFQIFSDEVVPEYLELFLKQPRIWKALRTGAKGLGARRETVSATQFLGLQFPKPSKSEQERIVGLLHKVETAMKINQEVGQELSALFNSSLASAFKGELASSESVEVQLGLGAIPSDVISINEQLRRKAALSAYFVNQSRFDKHLGRVKMEKFDQFVEAECGLDLGREPLSLAAGPADMESRNAVEEEAQKQNWYSVMKLRTSDGKSRYEYAVGKNIAEAISIAEEFMGDKKSAVDRLIKLLKPRTTHECSVIATLHEAWNNLLKLQRPVSDDAIIKASIASHSEKKKIPMTDWNWGLDWLQKNNVIPRGR